MQTKKCSRCGLWKSTSEYRKRSVTRDGLEYQCRDCKKALERRWRNAHKKKLKEKDRVYYINNGEKVRARVLSQKVQRQSCIFCERLGERHHPDYKEPLHIIFLCKSHHKQVHDITTTKAGS